jgi:MFS family permease
MTTAHGSRETQAPGIHTTSFRLLWAAQGISVLGSMTTSVVLPLIAVTVFDAGPQWVGALAAAVWLPWLVIGLPAGAWVDRLDARRVMVVADLAAAAALTSVPAAWALGLLSLPHLGLAALATGTASVFVRAAAPALLPRAVPAEALPEATARIYGTEAAMQVAGPGLGGALVAVVSAAWALVADVVSYIASALLLLRIDERSLAPRRESPEREPLAAEIGAGVRVVARDRYLRFFTVQGGVSNFGLTGYGALLVLHAVRDLGLDAGVVGVVFALGSVGGLLGAAVANQTIRWWGEARAMVALQVLGGPPALLVALGRPGWGVLVVPLGMALVGVGVVGANVIRSAFRMRYTPPHLIGRTMSTSALVNFGTMPLAGLAAGWLGATIGIRETIAAMATLHVAASLAALVGPYRRGRELPTQPMATYNNGSTATARNTTVT